MVAGIAGRHGNHNGWHILPATGRSLQSQVKLHKGTPHHKGHFSPMHTHCRHSHTMQSPTQKSLGKQLQGAAFQWHAWHGRQASASRGIKGMWLQVNGHPQWVVLGYCSMVSIAKWQAGKVCGVGTHLGYRQGSITRLSGMVTCGIPPMAW